MNYETELNFFQNFLKNSHISCHIITNPPEDTSEFDNGLRHLLNPDADLLKNLSSFLNLCRPNTIYRLIDEFMCRYFLFQLPDTEPVLYVLVGPYAMERSEKRDVQKILEKNAFPSVIADKVREILYEMPAISTENSLLTLVNTFGAYIWGGINNFSLQEVHNSVFSDLDPVAERPDYMEPMDAFLSMQFLEKRYSDENRLLKAVAQGQTHKAEMLISKFSSIHIDKRAADPIRNLKNYLIVTNTLLRKSAEAGAVHPLHIDSLSSRMALQIEQSTTENALFKLASEMVRKYCLLVKNHSMKGYSLLVRKILVRIDSDLTADLSLKAQAAFLDVNPSYLSTLFKKEMGTTLTEYVNRKRIEHGIFLLNTTQMQIQMIAQNCGIPDVNYFTKLVNEIVKI